MAAPVITPTPSNEKRYQCRIEELPTLSEFIIESLERDLADFSAHSPVYSADYLTELSTKRDEVIELIAPRAITDQKKTITKELYDLLSGMRQPLNKLENYVALAAARRRISVFAKDFGISRVRDEISNSDVEAVDGAMKILKKHIKDNYTALTDMGYTNAQRDALYKMWEDVNKDNAGQNLKDDERDDTAEKNTIKYNALWDIMIEVCSTGKSLYLIDEPAKADEYTMSSLINRMRNEDPNPRFRRITLDKGETRTLHNIIVDSDAKNTGTTIIAMWDSAQPQPPNMPELSPQDIFHIPAAWSSNVTVRNLDNNKKGEVRILALGSTSE